MATIGLNPGVSLKQPEVIMDRPLSSIEISTMVRLQGYIMRDIRLQFWSARNNWRLMRKKRTMKKVKLLDDTLEIQTFDLQESPKTGRITVLLGKDAQELRVVQAWVCAQSLSFKLWRHVAGYCFDASWPMGRSLAGSWSQFRCLPRSSLLVLIIDSTFLFSGDTATNSLCHLVVFPQTWRRLAAFACHHCPPYDEAIAVYATQAWLFFSTWPLRLS